MRFPFLLFFLFLLLSELAFTSLAFFDNNNNDNNDLHDAEIASFLESTLKSFPIIGSLNTPSTSSSSIFFEWPHPRDHHRGGGGSPSAPAMLVSSERIGWEMAATAGRKHAEIFYSSWSLSSSSSSSQVTGAGGSEGKAKPIPTEPIKPDPARYRRTFYPLNYLHNHLLNTGNSIFEAVWHLAAVAKPRIIGLFTDTREKKGGSPSSAIATASGGSITSALTCLPFGTRPNENVSCPLPPQGGTLRGRFPEFTQAVGVWELVKEAVALGYRTCSSSSSSPQSAAASNSNPSSPSMLACAVGRASEVLYWSMRADEYAVGKGRIVQFSVLLDIVQEEVGGETGSYWSAGVPSAVGLGLKGASVYRYTSKRAPPPHPQFVSFRSNGREGHEVLPPQPAIATAAKATAAQKAVKKGPAAVTRGLFPLNSYTYYESRLNVSGTPRFITIEAIKGWSAMADRDHDQGGHQQAKAHGQSSSNRQGDTTVQQESVIAELMSSRRISEWNITEIPLASSREGGREILKGYYDNLRGLLSAERPADSFQRDGAQSRAEYCAPLPASLPFCSFSEELSIAGNEKYLEFLAGPENRERQIPIRLEDSLEASVETGTGKGGDPNKKGGEAPAPAWRRALPIEVDKHGDKDASNLLLSPSSPAEMLTYLQRVRRQQFFSRTPVALDTDAVDRSDGSDVSTRDTPAPLVFKGDAEDIYSPFLDPRSPLYRRVLCATYSYHKNNERAAAFHVAGARHCDKHLLFTDKPIPPEILAKLNEDRFVVVALNTPGGEAYGNMWQKTRMILDTLELLVRGYEERTPEEGANDPVLSTRRPDDVVPTSPRRFMSPSLHIVHKEGEEKGEARVGPPQLVATVSSSGLGVREAAMALLPHYSGYDYVLLSGDDVCLNAPKLRRYLVEVDELFSVPLPASTFTHTIHSTSCNPRPHYRSATTPHHIGYSHKRFISGAAYLMNRQGYNNHMASGHSTCLDTKRTFAEDVMMGTCHRASGVMYRHTGSYGLLEDVFNSVSIEYVTGTVHTVRHTNWLTAFRRTVWPRNGAVTSKDSIVHHFCSVKSMQNFEQDLMSAISTVQ